MLLHNNKLCLIVFLKLRAIDVVEVRDHLRSDFPHFIDFPGKSQQAAPTVDSQNS